MADKKRITQELADTHYQIEPGITHIFSLCEKPEREAMPGTPIKLLEVNENTPASGVMPLHFGPAPERGIPFPSVIIEVTPAEFERIKQKKLKLPKGWTIGEELPRGNG
jgi:hypothetical protein